MNGVEAVAAELQELQELYANAADKQHEDNNVSHPSHYKFRGKEAIEIVKEMLGKKGTEQFLLGNALKYLYRYPKKHGIEDLKKARQCIKMIIDLKEE